jgi:hypothetical protein
MAKAKKSAAKRSKAKKSKAKAATATSKKKKSKRPQAKASGNRTKKAATRSAPAPRGKAAKSKAPKRAAAKKTSKKPRMVGEGDYQASRSFLKDQSDFVKNHEADIPRMGKDAERAMEGPEGKGLRAAEEEARRHSKAMGE